MAGRVSLAFRDLSVLTPNIVQELSKSCKVLDLTSNQISDILPLRDLPDLEELILDDNKITAHTKFPPMPRLQNLWVNRNQIDGLTLFIDKLESSCPSLIMLSMLNNEACPNYFNSGTPAQYQDYRYYVIGRLPKLQILDATPVSAAERQEAQKKYGNLTSTSQSEASKRAIEHQVQAKKKAERDAKSHERAEEQLLAEAAEKKRRKRTKKLAASGASSSSRSSTSASTTLPLESASTFEDSGLLDLPDIDQAQPKEATNPRVRVLPPIGLETKKSQEQDITQEIESDHRTINPDDVDWDEDDDDWSDSE